MNQRLRHGKPGRELALWWPVALCIGLASCSSETPVVPGTPQPPPPASFSVSSITDGDTLRFTPPQDASTTLRMLNIDAPESGQAPWGEAARSALLQLAPPSTPLAMETDETRLDAFGRLLAHATRSDGVNLNREQLRAGHAVVFVIWPNMSRFEEYRAAQIEAQSNQRGIWDPARPLDEMPFEYRLRIDRDAPFRPVGDFFTRQYVEPADYRRVHVNNRVFFNNTSAAAAAGYRPCPRDAAGDYADQCFAPGR